MNLFEPSKNRIVINLPESAKNRIGLCCLIVFYFLGIYMPCITKVPTYYLVVAIEICTIFYCIFRKKSHLFSLPDFSFLLPFLPFIIYYLVRFFALVYVDNKDSHLYVIEVKQMLLLSVFSVLTTIMVNLILETRTITKERYLYIYLYVGLLQLICVILSFAFPSIKSFFNNMIIRNSGSDVIVESMQEEWTMTYRGYGFAENLFDLFGYVGAILICITFALGIDIKRKSILLLSLTMLFMPLVSARTGIVLSGMGIAVILLKYKNPKRMMKVILYGVCLCLVLLILFDKLPNGLRNSLSAGFNDTMNLLTGKEKSGVYVEILGNDMILPSNILLGEGISPERITHYSGIDSGYIQSVWRYGLVGSLLFYGGYAASFVITMSRGRSKREKVTILVLIITFFVYGIKLFFYTNYSICFLLFSYLAFVNNRTSNETTDWLIKSIWIK